MTSIPTILPERTPIDKSGIVLSSDPGEMAAGLTNKAAIFCEHGLVHQDILPTAAMKAII